MRTKELKSKEYFTLRDARKVAYTIEPLICPSCKHVGELTYHQYINYFSCAWCGKQFKGK